MTLRLANIAHRFGRVDVLKGVTLEAAPGDVVCLFGPSGCGKTTLLRIAAGLEPLQSGSVEVGGSVIAEPGAELRVEKRQIGFVFQDYVLFPHLNVAQNISFGLSEKKADADRIVAAQLEALGLAGYEKRYPHELSGGQQQRVAIARALARSPKALLLDEPFASIDTVLRRRLREDLRVLLKAGGISVVLVTHDPEEALALADRIALMRDGQIIEAATPEELFLAPQTPEGASIFPDSQLIEGTISGGMIKTAFGEFKSDLPGDGPGIAVIRDGALSAKSAPDGALTMVDQRFAGPGWAVFLAADDSGKVLRALIPEPVAPDARFSVAVDSAGLFVFSRS